MSVHPILVLDTETTGNEPQEVIEFCAVDPISGETIVNKRYGAKLPISSGAMATHNIIESDIAGLPPYDPESDFPSCDYIVGHNVDFDWKALSCPNVKRICTLAISRYLWPDLDSHSLGAMMYTLMPQDEARSMVRGAHCASDDVKMTIVLLDEILIAAYGPGLGYLKAAGGIESLYQLSEKARIPTRFQFGKHKGELIADTPRSYREWMLKQGDVDPYLRRAIEGTMK